MTYEQWDLIADSFSPMLAIVTAAVPFVTVGTYRSARWVFYAATAISMAMMYGLGWLDAKSQLWAAAELDYSTHTGFAVVLIVSLLIWRRVAGYLATALFLAYVWLMLYQRYHTIADIATTALAVTLMTFAVHRTASLSFTKTSPNT